MRSAKGRPRATMAEEGGKERGGRGRGREGGEEEEEGKCVATEGDAEDRERPEGRSLHHDDVTTYPSYDYPLLDYLL